MVDQVAGELNDLGKLKVAAGELEDAQKDFQEAATTFTDPKARARGRP